MRLSALLLLLSAPAFAGDVFINGVNVEGLTNQHFDKVAVRIDEKGNVHIEAPGYKVQRVTVGGESAHATPKPVVSDAILSKRYFLVTEQSPQGLTEFNIDVAINGKALRTLHSSEEQIVMDVTKHLRPGRNTVLMHARKVLSNKEQPKSRSRTHVFRVIIGEGSMTEEQVLIEKPVITFTRTAAEPSDVAQEYELITR